MSRARTYDSALRAERAEETRLRIRKAARQLFTRRGFVATTIGEIAAAAGVAAPTVYAVFGGKAGIVREMLDELEEGAGLAGFLALREAEPQPRKQLRLFVSWLRALYEQGEPILRAATAALADPDVAALIMRGDDNRREGCLELTRGWGRARALKRGLKPKDAAERFWLLTRFEQYLFATSRLGWTPARYEKWLGDLLEAELLVPIESK